MNRAANGKVAPTTAIEEPGAKRGIPYEIDGMSRLPIKPGLVTDAQLPAAGLARSAERSFFLRLHAGGLA